MNSEFDEIRVKNEPACYDQIKVKNEPVCDAKSNKPVELPYKCMICNKSFKQPQSLRVHAQIHRDKWPKKYNDKYEIEWKIEEAKVKIKDELTYENKKLRAVDNEPISQDKKKRYKLGQEYRKFNDFIDLT